jgi:hypothetical protein
LLESEETQTIWNRRFLGPFPEYMAILRAYRRMWLINKLRHTSNLLLRLNLSTDHPRQ